MALAEETTLPSAWFATEFNQGKLKDYNLSVLAYRDGLVLLLRQQNSGKLQGVVRIANTGLIMQNADLSGLRVRLESSGLPQGRYNQVCLILRSERYNVVPGELMKDEDAEASLALRYVIRSGEKVLTCRRNGLASAFVSRPALEKLLGEYAPVSGIYSYGMLVALEAIRLSGGRKRVMIADLGSRSLDVAIAGKNGLEFCNAFPARTAEDTAYHFLNVYRQMGEGVKVFLTGNLQENSRASGLILPYLSSADYLRSDLHDISDELPGGKSDLFIVLNQMACGL